ncbi:UNVERIFIED_CONTAM: Siroheme synthase [Sesamum radiatum]|uniref:Siroheme synthase n=1 Tax=Sesamum radiatum TaxID=300843 RepID=A0AAW2PH13_SESRA
MDFLQQQGIEVKVIPVLCIKDRFCQGSDIISDLADRCGVPQLAKKLNQLEEIHELLLSFAEAGANVVRLKGGDPLVFGRVGEEMDFLQQGIEVKVIPVYIEDVSKEQEHHEVYKVSVVHNPTCLFIMQSM